VFVFRAGKNGRLPSVKVAPRPSFVHCFVGITCLPRHFPLHYRDLVLLSLIRIAFVSHG